MKHRSISEAGLSLGDQRGITLVELLVGIGLLAIITAIAIPNLSHATNAASKTSAQRNAQSLVSIATSASAAGLNFIEEDGEISTTVKNIVTGGVATDGILEGTYFGLSSLSEQSQERAIPFLKIEGGVLIYLGEE